MALLSAGVLGYEILLARLLAIVHWHHFAYMIIAVALLGFGAAGSLVAVFQRPLLARFRWTFGGAALGFGAGAPLAFALAQSLPFNALEIAWDRAQPAWLFALYLVLSLPFLSAALALALAFRAHAARAAARSTAWTWWAQASARSAWSSCSMRCRSPMRCESWVCWARPPAGSCCCGGGRGGSRRGARCWRWPPGSRCPRRSPITGCARTPRPTRG